MKPVIKTDGWLRDLAYVYFKARIAPGERVTLRPVHVERLAARISPRSGLVDYAPAKAVPAASVKPFRPHEFIFLPNKRADPAAWQELRVTSLQCDEDENIPSCYQKDGLPIATLLHNLTSYTTKTAAGVSLTIWNAGDKAVAFKARCTGATMPKEKP